MAEAIADDEVPIQEVKNMNVNRSMQSMATAEDFQNFETRIGEQLKAFQSELSDLKQLMETEGIGDDDVNLDEGDADNFSEMKKMLDEWKGMKKKEEAIQSQTQLLREKSKAVINSFAESMHKEWLHGLHFWAHEDDKTKDDKIEDDEMKEQKRIDDEVKSESKLIEVYGWVDSVWDMAYLIGVHGKSPTAVYSVLLVIINVVVQILLCLIINDAFTTPVVDDQLLQDLKLWRVSTGHNVEWMNELTDESLVGRICNGHTIVPVSSSVADVFQMTLEYVGLDPSIKVDYMSSPALGTWWLFDNHWIGIALCIMSCLIWWMIISQDAMAMFDLVAAIGMVPRGPSTVIKKYYHNRALTQISWNRRAFIYTIITLRAGVGFIMLMTGTIFMAYTVSLADLLLNAAALSIVLELDNLIFMAFAPGQARAMLRSMLPLPRPHDKKVAGVALRYPAVLIIMILSAIIMTSTVLVKQADDIAQVQKEICGGDVSFISVVAANGAVVASQGDSISTFADAASTYQYKAVMQLITKDQPDPNDPLDTKRNYVIQGMSTPSFAPDKGDLSGVSVGVRGPSYSLKSISIMPLEDIQGYWNTDCSDAPPLSACKGIADQGCWQMHIFHNVTGGKDLTKLKKAHPNIKRGTEIKSCADIKEYCGHDSLAGVRARQFCAKTCACDDPFAPNLFSERTMGCPTSCSASKQYKAKMAAAACQDVADNSVEMQNYKKGIRIAMADYPRGQAEFAEPIDINVTTNGCKAVAYGLLDSYGYKVDLCSTFNFFGWRNMLSICPATCKCSSRVSAEPDLLAYCPTQC